MCTVLGVRPLNTRATCHARNSSRSSSSMLSMSRTPGSPKCFRFRPKARTLLLVRRAACSMCTMLGERRFKWRATRHAVQHRWSQCHARAELRSAAMTSTRSLSGRPSSRSTRRPSTNKRNSDDRRDISSSPDRRQPSLHQRAGRPRRGFLTRSVPHLGHDPGSYFLAWLLSLRVVPQRISTCGSLCGATGLGCAENSPGRQSGVTIRRVRTYSGRPKPVFEFSNVLAHNEARFDSSSIRRVVRGRRWSGIFDPARGRVPVRWGWGYGWFQLRRAT